MKEFCEQFSRPLGDSGSSRASGQPLALHPPDQKVEAVLSEERLVLEHESRHAPMAGGRVVLFVIGDDLFITIGIGRNSGIHRAQVKACGRGGFSEMIPLLPALYRAVPHDPAGSS